VPLNGFGVISCKIGFSSSSSKMCDTSGGISTRELDSIFSLTSNGISSKLEKSSNFSSSIGISCNSNFSGVCFSGILSSSFF